MNKTIIEKASQIIKTCDAAYLGVIDENGAPSVSTVSPLRPEGIHEVYFGTSLCANKTQRLHKDPRASVCFHKGDDNITLVGEAEVLTDQETKSRVWESWFIEIFPGGETDPNYCVIKFSTKRASLWVGCESVEGAL